MFVFHTDKVSNTFFALAGVFVVCAFCVFLGMMARHTMKSHGSFGTFFADSYPVPTARKHDISVNMSRLTSSTTTTSDAQTEAPKKEGVITKLERQINKIRGIKKTKKQPAEDINVEDDEEDDDDQHEENITFSIV